jgi:hypothetical protein
MKDFPGKGAYGDERAEECAAPAFNSPPVPLSPRERGNLLSDFRFPLSIIERGTGGELLIDRKKQRYYHFFCSIFHG